MSDILVYFASIVGIASIIGAIGAATDGIAIKFFKEKITRAKKWLWNTAEMLVVFGTVIALGVHDHFAWFHIVIACANSWFIWRIVHDGIIGWIIAGDWFYMGQGAWDRKMLATYQNNRYLYFALNKCFPWALLILWFFNY